jgi:peptidoglycan/LPS O-acetylase OafA/YrhL
LRSGWFVIVPLLGIAANAGQNYALIDCLVGQTGLNLAIALCIDRCRRLPDGRVGRLLETRPLAGLGVLSYSLYLWQEPFLNRFARSPLTAFPLNLLLVFAAAVASYALIERPLLAWRHRLR